MLITLKGLDCEYGGMSIGCKEQFHFNTTTNEENLFSKDHLVERILKAQESGQLNFQWLDPDPFNNHKDSGEMSKSLIDMKTLKFYNDFEVAVSGKDVYMNDIIEFSVFPESNDEYDAYLMEYIRSIYRKQSINAVLPLLSGWSAIVDDFEVKEVGNYITIPAFVEYTSERDGYGCRKSIDHYYVIRKSDIQKTTIGIYAPERLIGHLIGKKGAQIAKSKTMLKEYCGEDKRINLAKAK